MYALEPILNAYYRLKMRSVLAFAEVKEASVPAPDSAGGDHRLLYIHIPFCEALCPIVLSSFRIRQTGRRRVFRGVAPGTEPVP
jgi:coproporphyrinogen III oxidase-like Fe-S oxidoreductase